MLGEQNTEQFEVVTWVDGQRIKSQIIHDPFIHNRTVVGISRWDLFKAMFRRQYEVKVEVNVRGTLAVQRAIMTLDPHALAKENLRILEEQNMRRETGNLGDCFVATN
jgi:hypothetical protein